MRRYVTPGVNAAVWISSGRWGPSGFESASAWRSSGQRRRIRTSSATMPPDKARRTRSVEWALRSRSGRSVSLSADWELRANAVWRHGRLFFRCPECTRLATRLYVPCEDAGAACRRCWGLTYDSRRENYKSAPSFLPCYSLGQMARWLTWSAQERRAAASADRYAERREILNRSRKGGARSSRVSRSGAISYGY